MDPTEIPALLQVDTSGIKNPPGVCVQKQHQRSGNPSHVSLTPSLHHRAGISTHGISTTGPVLIPKNCYPLEKPHPQAQTPWEHSLECTPKGMFGIKARLQVPGWLVPRANPESIGLGYPTWSSCSFPVFLTQPSSQILFLTFPAASSS